MTTPLDGPVDAALALVRTVEAEARETLAGLPRGIRRRAVVLYAAAPAERLQTWHDSLPSHERRTYSTTWRPVLDRIWEYAGGDDQAYYPISHALGHFYLSPQNHIKGPNGPDGTDQHEAAAVYYAANAVLHGCVDFALWSANRATDAIDNHWFDIDEEQLLREITVEVERQRTDLRRIADAAKDEPAWSGGAPTELIATLRSPR